MFTTQVASASECVTVAIVGNPNTGKSTLFNALAGVHTRIGNFPGVTVEKKVGRVVWEDRSIDLVDLPGTYSLSARTMDEMLAVDVVLGRQDDIGKLDLILCVVDASNLERNLYLASQLLEVGVPLVLVLNKWDLAQSRGVTVDIGALSDRIGIPVVTTAAHRKEGLDALRKTILTASGAAAVDPPTPFPRQFYEECDRLSAALREATDHEPPRYLLQRLVLDTGGYVESCVIDASAHALRNHLTDARQRLAQCGHRVPEVETQVRYDWIRTMLSGVVTQTSRSRSTTSDKIDRFLTHGFAGLLILGAVMFLVFQAIYHWAVPFMDAIEAGQDLVASAAVATLPPGALRSLLVNGVIAGVGSVIVFLPQIAFLFFFIAVLEDCGYLARAAFLTDTIMTKIGLSGTSFVPLMSSFACAVPGIMATRVIENRRDRMVTLLVAPLMSCSARLPVYLLLIGAFIPSVSYLGGWVSLRGVVLFFVCTLGAITAIPIAWILKKTFFRGEAPPFVLELPDYKWPSPRIVLSRVYDRSKAFVAQAGTLIFATTVLVWAAGYFPVDHTELHELQAQLESMDTEKDEAPERTTLVARQHQLQGELLASSLLGKAGKSIEPIVKPLGWDWRIGVGVIAAFPAREVVIATLGTIYSLGGDVDEESQGLIGSMRAATWPDGTKVYNVPVALSIMVFFALCAQCGSTLVVIKRETNSWRWPLFAFSYMTLLAYVAAWLTFNIGMMIG